VNDEKMYVPYIVYEGEMARQERHIKRLVVMLAVMLVLFFASNMAWLYVWNQYEYVGETIEASQDGSGVNIVGGEDVNYGSDGSDTQEKAQEEER
jgi:multidrug resistance efflux pump